MRRFAVDAAGEAEADQLLEHWQSRMRILLFDRDRWREHGPIALALLERESLTGAELGSLLSF